MSSLRVALDAALKRRRERATGRLRKAVRWAQNRDAIGRYQAMCADNDGSASLYQAGAFWKEINADFEDLIWAGSLERVRDAYFTERFSSPEPDSWQTYFHYVTLYYNYLLPRDRLGFLATQSEPEVGGTSRQIMLEGRRVSADFLLSVEDAYAALEAWTATGKAGTPRIIVELGAGYGRLAYVARRLMPDCTYVILDLPEALMCSSSWLSRALPGEVVPYEESRGMRRFGREELASRRVWTLGAHQIEQIDADAADMFVNIRSFAEMPRAAIENYFREIDRIVTGALYSVQRKREDNVVDREVISEATYPIPSHWSRLYYRDFTSIERTFFQAAYGTRGGRPA